METCASLSESVCKDLALLNPKTLVCPAKDPSVTLSHSETSAAHTLQAERLSWNSSVLPAFSNSGAEE